jgi:hypothetical protein
MLVYLFGWLLAVHVAPMSREWLRRHDAEFSKHTTTSLLLAIGLAAAAPAAFASNRAFASADAAQSLVRLLAAEGLDAVAAAEHPSADAVEYRIAMRQFREVYLDLQGTPTAEGKLFVQDAGADGILSATPGSGAVDIVYTDGAQQTLFNGNYREQKLTEAEYDARLAAADASYARLLTLLVSELSGR